MAQSLGVEGRGQLASLLQPLTVADSIAAIGIPTATAFFIARGAGVRQVQRLALTLGVITAFLTFGFLCIYSFGVSRSQGISQLFIVLIWSSVIPGVILAIRRSGWTGLQKWKRIDCERTVFAGSRLALIVVIAAVGLAQVEWFAAAPLAVGLLVSSCILFRRFPRISESRPQGNEVTKADFYRFSAYAAMGTVSASASARLDQALMPSLTTSEQLGLYAVAVTVAEVPLLVGTVLSRNLMAEASAGVPLGRMLRHVLLGFGVAVLGSALIGVLSKWLIPIFFGPPFAASIGPEYVLLGATCLSVVTIAFCAILTGWNHPLFASIPQIGSVAVVIVSFSLVGTGINAWNASWISLFAQLTSCLIVIILMRIVGGPKRGRHRLNVK